MSASYEYRLDLRALDQDERRLLAAALRLRRAVDALERAAARAERTGQQAAAGASRLRLRPRTARRR